jgi:hypothetical protein
MIKRLLVGTFSAVLLLAGVAGANSLKGKQVNDGPSLPDVTSVAACAMQKGFVVSQGIGCSNGTGTSGGPNDVAEGLTLCTAAPVDVKTFSYIVQTPGVPGFATSARFAAWSDAGGGTPGAQMCTGPAVPFLTAGTFSVPLTGCKITTAMTNGGHFFAGMNQGGIGGMRWGYDSSGSAIIGDAYIRAASCGATNFLSLTALGLPGAWVFRVTVDAQGPIEVEQFSWGEVKAKYHQ